jgi:cation diffusion facilitator CzcD-associated flavoprotein CzcO
MSPSLTASVVVVALVCARLLLGVDGRCTEAHSTCIVGAGPAGLQLGRLLHQAGRDAVTFERGARAATFFQKFPIHRQLNSINRRQPRMAPGEDTEFDLRHDHNSLLGGDAERVPKRTDEYWVPADSVVEYMNDFARPQTEAGRIRYCHDVQAIRQVEGCAAEGATAERFVLSVAAHSPCDDAYNTAVKSTRFSSNLTTRTTPLPGAQSSQEICCASVVMAHGMTLPNIPEGWISGLVESSVGYEELDLVLPNSSDAQGKSILILGSGNAAYETVDNLRNWAADLQVGARRVADSLARDTKYIGGIRGRRTTILDAFHLKSYEGITR